MDFLLGPHLLFGLPLPADAARAITARYRDPAFLGDQGWILSTAGRDLGVDLVCAPFSPKPLPDLLPLFLRPRDPNACPPIPSDPPFRLTPAHLYPEEGRLLADWSRLLSYAAGALHLAPAPPSWYLVLR